VKAVAPGADEIFFRNPAIGKVNGGRVRAAKPHFSVHGLGLIARPVGFHGNDAVAFGPGRIVRVREAEDEHKGALGAVADHDLGAV